MDRGYIFLLLVIGLVFVVDAWKHWLEKRVIDRQKEIELEKERESTKKMELLAKNLAPSRLMNDNRNKFEKHTTITERDGRYTVSCNKGLWSVDAPSKEKALQEAARYYFQYWQDGEYDDSPKWHT